MSKKTGKAKQPKPEVLICGGCANDIAPDDTAGTGGCARCEDGIPRCGDCLEIHAAECE